MAAKLFGGDTPRLRGPWIEDTVFTSATDGISNSTWSSKPRKGLSLCLEKAATFSFVV